jgi:hypothetical protein
MESETNKIIREKLEELGLDTNKLYGDFTLVGHISKLFYGNLRREHYQRMASMVNSHGFIGYLMGEYELKDKSSTPSNTIDN